ncbi:unnamed protein product [Effrenium voratum]|nr:unnamed protein product [Effrenium voratum]
MCVGASHAPGPASAAGLHCCVQRVPGDRRWDLAVSILEDMRHAGQQVSALEGKASSLSLVRAGALASWGLAVATWRALSRRGGDEDTQAEVVINISRERMDRSANWKLALEMVSAVQRQSMQPSRSLLAAVRVCSQSGQWAATLALRHAWTEAKDQFFALQSRATEDSLAHCARVVYRADTEAQCGAVLAFSRRPGPVKPDHESLAQGRGCLEY